MNTKPNILLIVIDCLRQDHCPAESQGTRLTTWPCLCEQGTYFTQMISTASTTPVCFASMFTGHYPFVHGLKTLRGYSIVKDIPVLPEILKQKGYHTYAYMTGPMRHLYGLDRGFEVYDYRDRDKNIYSQERKSIIHHFANQDHEEPWFFVLHLFELHRPYQLNGRQASNDRAVRYDAAWEELDKRLADLITNIQGETLVIMTADHGESLQRRSDSTSIGHLHRKLRDLCKRPRRPMDWKGHGFFLYDELIRIPCVICGPGIPKGNRISPQVRQIDLMPTILDLVGIQVDIPIQGDSLIPLIWKHEGEERLAFAQTGWIQDDPTRNWHGLRSEQWKYVERPRSGPHIHLDPILFDLKHDPQERKNVIQQHPQIAIGMRQELDILLHDPSNYQKPVGNALTQEENQVLEKQLMALGYL